MGEKRTLVHDECEWACLGEVELCQVQLDVFNQYARGTPGSSARRGLVTFGVSLHKVAQGIQNSPLGVSSSLLIGNAS